METKSIMIVGVGGTGHSSCQQNTWRGAYK